METTEEQNPNDSTEGKVSITPPNNGETPDPMAILTNLDKVAKDIDNKLLWIETKMKATQEYNQKVMSYLEGDMALKDSVVNKVSGIEQAKDAFKTDFKTYFDGLSKGFFLRLNKADRPISLTNESMIVIRHNTAIGKNLIGKQIQTLGFFKHIKYGMIGLMVFSAFFVVFFAGLTLKWYATSIRTRQETREAILTELKQSGQGIYTVDEIKELEYNTNLLKAWIESQKKTTAVKDFSNFKQGYDSSHKTDE